jgi:hypothetical protein
VQVSGVGVRTIGRAAAWLLAGTALALCGCHEEARPSATSARGLSDWLVECSPFSTYDAGKAIDFAYDGTFELDRGDNRAAWDLSLPEHVTGKWFGQEEGLSFDATLPGKAPVH